LAEYKIVFTDYYYPNIDREREILNALGDVEIVDCTQIVEGGVKSEEAVLEHGVDADAMIVQFAKISRKVIAGLQRCRIISRYAIGVDTIDVKAAKEKGIAVANVPDYCIEEVSDTAIAHMFNCLRKVTLANNLLHQGRWSYEGIRPLYRFAGLSVGLIAFGNIAKRVAEKLRSFGVQLLAYDPFFSDRSRYPWIEFLQLEELLKRSDVVSVHAPHTEQTHHLLNEEKFRQMKDGVILINTSRGGLVDERALSRALESGKVAMAGLDVLDCPDGEYENSVVMKYPERVFVTRHTGWYSEESIADLKSKTARNVYEMLSKGRPLYSV